MANEILNEVPADMLMFSVNPAYDYGSGEFAYGGVSEREAEGKCVGCGHCDSRCPFHVNQSARMQEIWEYFA